MRALFIGGTGTISMAITRLAVEQGWEIYLLNRGNRNAADLPSSSLADGSAAVKQIIADVYDEADVASKIADLNFDVVCDFIAFHYSALERDYRLFKNKTKQFMYISSASAYQKPLSDYRVTEATPLVNPYWEYSRNKIAGEEFLMRMYREEGFPITIVRPSHTYDERRIPLGVHGKKGSWQVAKRMLEGKPVIIHGDGTSLWTMTHNSDFAKGFVGLMGNIHAIGESFQITSDETVTWNQVYQAIANVLGVELKAVHVASEFLAAAGDPLGFDFTGSLIGDKANSVVFDNSKLKKAVPGFSATIRFDQGIRRTIENVLAHPELQEEDPEFDAWCDKVIAALEQAKKLVP
ncbi:MAG: SDR family oxidoreductase [Fibrobacter sp.]|nr:SDR family oxidoreductase [Fibrobacter sp.]